MSVQTEIDRIISAVDAAHTKVREKGGTTARPYLVANLAGAIDTIPTGEDITEPLAELNTINGGTPATTMSGAVDNTGDKVDDQADLIAQIQTALEGKAAGGGGAAPKLQEKTVIPSVSGQTVEPDSGYDGLSEVTVEGDADLVADNIKSGVSIFGVTGNFEGGGAVYTTTASVTSNNQQISFTGLSAQPKAFAVTPIGNVTLNANNRLVMSVSFDGTTTHGIYIVSGGSSYNRTYTATYSSSYFTRTYSNGTLTLRTSSTTNGGYFAANVNYALIAIC